MKESININLLPSKSRLQLKQIETIRRVNLVVGIALGVFLLVGVIVFSLDFLSQSQIRKNTRELETAKQQFIQFADRIDELQDLRFRTKLVAQTLEKRFLFAPGLEKLEELLGSEAVLSSLSASNGLITIKGELPKLSSLKVLEEKLVQEKYSAVVLKGLGVKEDGWVSFSLEISFEDIKG